MNFIAIRGRLFFSLIFAWNLLLGVQPSPQSVVAEGANPSMPPLNIPIVENTSPPPATHAVRIQYKDYQTSRAEIPGMVARLKKANVNLVGLAAGRVEWAFFKWPAHPEYTSNAVKASGIDFLAEDSAIYGQFAHINAVIDVLSPNYILAHPDSAAINAYGQRSRTLVGTMDLVAGEYSQLLLNQVEYISANYPRVNSISITELSYRLDGYGPKEKKSFLAYSGLEDWPRLSNGKINIDDPRIGDWRSRLMDVYLDKLAAVAHVYGKEFYLDVTLSTTSLSTAANEYGTRYDLMLQHIDKLIVWGYYYLEDYPPEYLKTAAQFLARYGRDRVIMSIGMWGPTAALMTPDLFLRGLVASEKGGLPDIWVTPSIYMDDSLWQVLYKHWNP